MRVATPYKHPVSGIYYFRRAVPRTLQQNLGRSIIKISLGTRDPSEAMRLFATKQIECESIFNAARNGSVFSHQKYLLLSDDDTNHSKSKVTLQYLLDKFNQERDASKKTMDEAQKVVGRFTAVYGDINAEDIDGKTIREFKELLIKTPARMSNDLRSLSLLQILDNLGDNHTLETLSDSSINKYLSAISSVLVWASNNSYFDANWHNPVLGKTIKRNTSRKQREPFSDSDLHKIFTSDIYTKGWRPKGGCGEAAYWIPLIGLYTGMRLEEVGQLLVPDIKCDDGIWYFDVNDKGDKHLKNSASVRKVPVHQKLLSLGLIEYVSDLDGASLFPLLQKDKYGKLTQVWSKWFGRHLRRVGVIESSKVYHSYRHGMKDFLRNAGVDEAISDAITGHTSSSVGRSYGYGYNLNILNQAIQKVSYDIPVAKEKW